MLARKITLALLAATALGCAGAANAADLYTPAPEAVPVAASPFSWSGVYFGAHVGYSWSKAANPGFNNCNAISNIVGENGDSTYIDGYSGANICDADYYDYTGYDAYVSDSNSYYYDDYIDYLNLDGDYIGLPYWDRYHSGNTSGFMYGAQVGINQQYGNLVVGLEADISGFANQSRTDGQYFEYFHSYDGSLYNVNVDGDYFVEAKSKLDWLSTFRGRLGVAFGAEGRFLGYVTGGAAVAHVSSSIDAGVADYIDGRDWCDNCSFGNWRDGDFYQFGYAAGIGFEYAFTNHVSLGLEYLFVGLSGQRNNSVTFYGDDGRSFDINQKVGFDSLQFIRAKLNFKL